MSGFVRALRQASTEHADGPRRWVYVPYDQLTDALGPLSRIPARELGIVLVESPYKAGLRPYHKQKLALVLANGRHFALEQARRGVAVEYVVAQGPYRDALSEVVSRRGALTMMEAAERELRVDIAPLVERGSIEVVPHEGWLTTQDDFDPKRAGPPWRMDPFYRRVRKRLGILLDDEGKPLGGKWSHDASNRRAWPGTPPAPTLPSFEPDPITREVGDLITRVFARHPGNLELQYLPATREDARTHWDWALRTCMDNFGPFEDAMSQLSRTLFHTRISGLLNLHRLVPANVIKDVLAIDIPLSSKEGFVRQVIGWREYVRHVHQNTDGLRDFGPHASAPGDGGYARWAQEPWQNDPPQADGGSCSSWLGTNEPLPPAFWGAPSAMSCLDNVVRDVWDEGYSHHITRLMVLSNIATLLDVSPRELTDWFWAAYTDAYDWVVEPNVLGMGTFALGPVMTTKPYVCGSAYIAKMSDYCRGCAFDPKTTCPITRLYWAFLERHHDRLRGNHRLSLVMGSVRKRSAQEKRRDAATFESVRAALRDGDPVPAT